MYTLVLNYDVRLVCSNPSNTFFFAVHIMQLVTLHQFHSIPEATLNFQTKQFLFHLQNHFLYLVDTNMSFLLNSHQSITSPFEHCNTGRSMQSINCGRCGRFGLGLGAEQLIYGTCLVIPCLYSIMSIMQENCIFCPRRVICSTREATYTNPRQGVKIRGKESE